MKKNKTKSAVQRSRKKPPLARKPVDLNVVRQNIANLVGGRAVSMVETTIGEVDKGHYAAMKYLFEMVGLDPGSGEAAATGSDNVLAKTLLRRLELPEEAKLEETVTKGTEGEEVESGGSEKDAVE